jgi:hypothetical protein
MDEMLDRAKNYGLADPEGLVLSYIVGAHDSDEVFNDVPENYNDLNIIQNGVSMMQKEIECIAPVLCDAGYPHKISIHSCTIFLLNSVA